MREVLGSCVELLVCVFRHDCLSVCLLKGRMDMIMESDSRKFCSTRRSNSYLKERCLAIVSNALMLGSDGGPSWLNDISVL